jgi:chorismate mutase-like protein
MKESSQDAARKKLAPYRKRIDALDTQILKLLGKRFAVVRNVARIKIRHDIRIVQSDRVREVKERNAALATKYGISPDLVRTLYTLIIDEAHTVEHALKKKKRKT